MPTGRPHHAQLHGRDADLRALLALLGEGHRAITLLGPGGVGKTRLALAVAEQTPDACFCALQAHRAAPEMAGAVARALGMVLRGADPVEELAGLLHTKGPCLLILDNLEQLAPQASDALERWLEAAPDLRLLVTSQRRLNLREERLLQVEPLSLEAGCALFVARASAVGVRLTDAEVAPLVEALDRLPLALELAAARCRVMRPREILERLSQRFQLLSGRRTGPERHASLRATLTWTWTLLSPLQQQALSQLSLFQSRFSMGDAEAVLSLPEDCYPPDLLAELVDFSLVQPAPDLQLLISVRDFALARLEDQDAARERHARWVAAFATQHYPGQRLSVRRPRYAELMPDAMAALDWCLSKRNPLGGECALVMSAIREQAGPQQATGQTLVETLALPGLSAWVQLRLWLQLSHSHRYAARLPEFAQTLAKAQQLAEPLGPVALGQLAMSQGTYHWYAGDLETARLVCKAGLAGLPETAELGSLRGRLMGAIANMSNQLGDVAVARATYQAALDVTTDPTERAVLYGNLGLLEFEDGCFGPAELFLQESIETARAHEFRALEGVMLGNLGLCRAGQGDSERACVLLTQASEISAGIGDLRSVRYQRASLAELLLERGELAQAGSHLEFLRREPAREESLAVLLLSLHVEWLARTGATGAAQAQMDDVLRAAEANGLVTLEGAIYARLARLVFEGLLQGDAPALLARAEAIAERLNSRESSDLARTIARARAVVPRSPDLVADDLSWVLGTDGPVDLRRRPLMRRLLSPLRSGEAAPTAVLLEAGWPDSKLPPDRLAPRLYSALHELRRLGVHVESRDGHYRLRPPSES